MLQLNRNYFDNVMAKKQMNSSDLAKKAGLSNATVSKILKNNVFYTYKTLGKIAKALDVKEPNELLQEK